MHLARRMTYSRTHNKRYSSQRTSVRFFDWRVDFTYYSLPNWQVDLFIPDFSNSGILTLVNVVKMAFDSFFSRGDRAAAQNREITDEKSWAHPRDGFDVHDTSSDRNRMWGVVSAVPLSVTLWDEAAPAPLAFRDPPDDSMEG
jgi:hypothetical protein